jgi:nuclear RNA export factor
VETGLNRSFDRSFLLTPAPAGSRALQYGLPVVVMNDMLHVRNYVQSSAGDAKPPAIGSPGPSLPVPSSLSLTPSQTTMPLFGAPSSSPFTPATSSEVPALNGRCVASHI